jgi:hypothetical protein
LNQFIKVIRSTLQKENFVKLKLFFVILNNFRAVLTQNGKENFLKQLETIVESVKQNRVKIERRQQEERSKRDALNIQLAQLVDKARQYAKVFKDFQEV